MPSYLSEVEVAPVTVAKASGAELDNRNVSRDHSKFSQGTGDGNGQMRPSVPGSHSRTISTGSTTSRGDLSPEH